MPSLMPQKTYNSKVRFPWAGRVGLLILSRTRLGRGRGFERQFLRGIRLRLGDRRVRRGGLRPGEAALLPAELLHLARRNS